MAKKKEKKAAAPKLLEAPQFQVQPWSYNGRPQFEPPKPPIGADGKPDLTDPDYAARYDKWLDDYLLQTRNFEWKLREYEGQQEARDERDNKAKQEESRGWLSGLWGGNPLAPVEGALEQKTPATRPIVRPADPKTLAPPPVRPPAAGAATPEAAGATPPPNTTGWLNQMNPRAADQLQSLPVGTDEWLQSLLG